MQGRTEEIRKGRKEGRMAKELRCQGISNGERMDKEKKTRIAESL
jgi:hypothetical protein